MEGLLIGRARHNRLPPKVRLTQKKLGQRQLADSHGDRGNSREKGKDLSEGTRGNLST